MEAVLSLEDRAVPELDQPANSDGEAGGSSKPGAEVPGSSEDQEGNAAEKISGPEQLVEEPQLEDMTLQVEQRQQDGGNENADNGGEASAEEDY